MLVLKAVTLGRRARSIDSSRQPPACGLESYTTRYRIMVDMESGLAGVGNHPILEAFIDSSHRWLDLRLSITRCL